ncbi:MAG: AAC(3) family N-acetyltransferase [Alphaproteobacteria bacterium]|nr:AAC(3) family N-acetyltransferase [Alphaproteobacteria bacterium]
MPHFGMRAIGPVDGGGDGLLAALRAAVDPGGTVLVLLCSVDHIPFDRVESPVDVVEMGWFPELVRRTPGVSLTDHPAARFAAMGARADWLLHPQPVHHYYGPGSPLERFIQAGGKVLRAGAAPDTTTLTHHAEYAATLPHKRAVRRHYMRADTGPVAIDSLDDSGGIVDWAHGDYFPRIRQDFVDAGHARRGPLGATSAECFDAPAFHAWAVAWIERHLAG